MFESEVKEIGVRNLKVHGIEVFCGGEVIFRHSFSPDVRYPIYSAAKTFTSAAVGIAGDEGRLSADAPLYEFLPRKYLDCIPSERLGDFKKLTFKRFLTMSVRGYPFRPEGNDWLEFALSLPIDYSQPPVFSYSNIPAYLVGIACENAVGEHLIKYLTPRLFEPLGIEDPVYANCPGGHFYGATGMALTVHELSMLGRLYLQEGAIDGKRLLSVDWVRQSTSPQISNSDGGYGYFVWTSGDSFRISGKWGQKCLVYPKKDLTVTYLSDMPEGADEMLKIACRMAESL